ncbi:MAG: hypothetical protein MJ135_06080 [Oscillospiraceae bacterium]|nr:hypothetical protein [Oscillospiraceae bacterium]
MSLKELLFILLAAALADHLLFTRFLSAVPMLGRTGTRKTITFGLIVAGITALASAVNHPIRNALISADKAYFCAYAAVIAALAASFLVEFVLKDSQKSLGVYYPVTALNAAFLTCVCGKYTEGFKIGGVLLRSFGGGLGLLLAMLALGGVLDEINEKYVPAAFRGLPVMLLAASIVSMVLFAF